MEWSMWPTDAPQTRGVLVELEAGQERSLDAEIAQVVDTRGVLSGDFHVHSVDSPDSPVRHRDRVLGFMADGVDVLVSTDHDRIADLRPTIEELGAQGEIVNLMGVELTTSHYGHYNSFPQVKDPNSRNGGAVDWAGGAGPGLKPAEIFAGLRAAPGEQVVQVNHPSDAFGGIKADLVRGISLGDPTALRIAPSEPDPVTGDTGLFSEDFTAMEVMNGLSLPKMWGYWRWWLQMIGRGFTPTGTAVTDTHRLRRQENGTPRTYVFLPEGKDTLENFDAEAFAVAVNQHRAIGTNGPFFRVSVTGAEGQVGTLGDTVAANAGRVQVRVEYDVPEWVVVNRVDVFTNLRDPILTEIGQRIEDEVPPSRSIEFEPAAPTEAVEGATGHRHRAGVVEFELEVPQDAYVILVLRGVGDEVPGMFPAIFDGRVRPFAFANPFFVDADGGGYNNPPLADLARLPSEKPRPVTPVRERKALLEALIEHYGHTDH
jgi:hypothetical protein